MSCNSLLASASKILKNIPEIRLKVIPDLSRASIVFSKLGSSLDKAMASTSIFASLIAEIKAGK